MRSIHISKEEADAMMAGLQALSAEIGQTKSRYEAAEKKVEELERLMNSFTHELMVAENEFKDQSIRHLRLINGIVKHFMEPRDLAELAGPTQEPFPLVYFIQCKRSKRVKIGTTKNLGTRFETLQRDHGKLEVLRTAPGTFQEEAFLHRAYAASRHVGEWFRLSPELQKLINEIDPYIPLSQQFESLGLAPRNGVKS